MPQKATESNWTAYYRATAGRPARDTLLKALATFDAELSATATHFALDLGCGIGQDTFELLRRGWRVLAIDADAEAVVRIRVDALPELPQSRLEVRQMAFEQITELPLSDLINASFSLPFCTPGYFPTLWGIVVNSVRSGGRFAGQLFGVHDTWATDPDMNFHTSSDVEKLLTPFMVESLDEVERDGQTATGEEKHWHIFHIIARRR